ncbi:ATP-bind-3 domain-containing protein [Mycena indigotica]|uniref:tRNA(Ile)-lysidine synthetase n=1 Tax=Mycena indigotica TaxID=2126181 RepID=A0A8H6VXJ7_9AGAR|nr:ATP-bind-3 domain-containing protein [Mycena indigotica]KAF7295576.1 ATP-bind-3 domain-containing protein [Mycena indigotica]
MPRGAPPISADEFARFLKKCTPLHGWTRSISVANSGGPDSTALLFLLKRHIDGVRANSPHSLPAQLYSLTVDHALQPESAKMAKLAEERATSMGIPHVTSRVPWGQDPFPEHPGEGDAFEETGRVVRYRLLLDRMKELDSYILALGHHGDDQVETSLMRLAKGTTEIGAGGMRKVRRWGMGMHNNDLNFAGMDGMRRWMIRPLLDLGKERILATCYANNLEFATDTTNFQPELTLRNAIRTLVSQNSFEPESLGPNIPLHILDGLQQIKTNISTLQSVEMDPSGGLDHLRSAVSVLSNQLEDIDSLVDSGLNRCHLPSPAGTYLVSSRGLATVNDPLVQHALVLRIMRYVSFFAWGTIRADANRRRVSIERIIRSLWTPDPFQSGVKPFVAGGGVVWTPVLVTKSRLKFPVNNVAPVRKSGDLVGWLASRQVPFIEARLQALGMPNVLKRDITEQLRAYLAIRHEKPGQIFDFLWDNRFLLHINVDGISEKIARAVLEEGNQIWVYPHSRWFWPKVVQFDATGSEASETVLHSTLTVPKRGIVPLDRDVMLKWPQAYTRDLEEITAPWIETEYIRSLSAL